MPGAFVETDLQNVLDDTELATSGLIVGGTLVGQTVVGFHDRPYADSFDVAGATPTFRCTAPDVDGIAQNDRIDIDAFEYRVADITPDGRGMVVLTLHEV